MTPPKSQLILQLLLKGRDEASGSVNALSRALRDVKAANEAWLRAGGQATRAQDEQAAATQRAKAATDSWARGLAQLKDSLDPMAQGLRQLKLQHDEQAAATQRAKAATDSWARGLSQLKASQDPFQQGLRQLKLQQDEQAAAARRAAAAQTAQGHATNQVIGLLRAYLSLRLVQETIALADAYTRLTGQIRLVTRSEAELVATRQQLLTLANETRSDAEATATLYAKLRRSTSDLGLTQGQVLTLTKAVNQGFQLTGESAAAATAAMIQLGQAFASGQLRGDELRSVLEQAPRLAEAIAKGMGISVGQLRKLGEEGKLTSRAVATALLSQAAIIEAEFQKMPRTVAQSAAVMRNEMLQTIGRFNELTGASRGIGATMIAVGRNLDTAAVAVGGLAAAWAAIKWTEITRWLAGVATGIRSITAALASNPIGAAIVVATLSASALLAMWNDVKRVQREAEEEAKSGAQRVATQWANSDDPTVLRRRLELASRRLKEVEDKLRARREGGVPGMAAADGARTTSTRASREELEGLRAQSQLYRDVLDAVGTKLAAVTRAQQQNTEASTAALKVIERARDIIAKGNPYAEAAERLRDFVREAAAAFGPLIERWPEDVRRALRAMQKEMVASKTVFESVKPTKLPTAGFRMTLVVPPQLKEELDRELQRGLGFARAGVTPGLSAGVPLPFTPSVLLGAAQREDLSRKGAEAGKAASDAAAQASEARWKRAAENIQDALSNGFRAAFDAAISGAGGSGAIIADTFKRVASEIAAGGIGDLFGSLTKIGHKKDSAGNVVTDASGNAVQSLVGKALGSMAGVVAPVAGGVVGSVVGKLVGGLFGGINWAQRDRDREALLRGAFADFTSSLRGLTSAQAELAKAIRANSEQFEAVRQKLIDTRTKAADEAVKAIERITGRRGIVDSGTFSVEDARRWAEALRLNGIQTRDLIQYVDQVNQAYQARAANEAELKRSAEEQARWQRMDIEARELERDGRIRQAQAIREQMEAERLLAERRRQGYTETQIATLAALDAEKRLADRRRDEAEFDAGLDVREARLAGQDRAALERSKLAEQAAELEAAIAKGFDPARLERLKTLLGKELVAALAEFDKQAAATATALREERDAFLNDVRLQALESAGKTDEAEQLRLQLAQQAQLARAIALGLSEEDVAQVRALQSAQWSQLLKNQDARRKADAVAAAREVVTATDTDTATAAVRGALDLGSADLLRRDVALLESILGVLRTIEGHARVLASARVGNLFGGGTGGVVHNTFNISWSTRGGVPTEVEVDQLVQQLSRRVLQQATSIARSAGMQ